MTSAREMAELSNRYLDAETERAIEYCECFIEQKFEKAAKMGFRGVRIEQIPKSITIFSLIVHLNKHGYKAWSDKARELENQW